MDWSPRQRGKQGSKSVQTCDNFILGATDGRFYLLTRNGKADKGVEAHQGAVLAVRWNQDGTSFATAWAPDGQLFAVGSFNMMRLCDRHGWSYAVVKTQTGSLLNMRWSADGTQIAAAGGNGEIIVGQVTDRWIEWNGFEAAVVDERTVEVQNIRNGATEHLEFRDRVTKASLAYNQLIVVTSSQCYVYRYFVLVDGMNIYVYSYDGRLVCSPKQPNLRTDLVHATGFALSNDTIAVKNGMDEKTIYLFETASGKPIGDGKPIVHSNDVVQIGLDQCGPPLHQRLVILDRNKDLYLMSVRVFGTNRKSTKLTTMASSFIWSQTSNILAAVVNDNISVWYYPNIAFVDSDLLALTTHEHDTQEEFGKQPELLSFYRDRITIRRINGSVSSLTVSPYPDKLHQLIATNKWNEALSLCRNVKDKMLWACLAGFATCAKDLDMAEIAFAEIEEVDKVEYIRYIKGLPKKEMQTAEMLMLSGEYQDAEGVLLQAGLYFRAIMLHLNSYNWNRAIELATKHKLALDIVLSMRQAYLQQANRTETLERYLSQPRQNLLSTNALKERIEKEYEREQAHKEAGNTKPTSPQNRSRPTVVT
ncbi:intraflagellar transport protein 80 homolog [Clonorchis sinensis]|uniref:Intraflagellar transport protein 80 homolog n=1 Tax=Clonorchis sinensis TaxID=79923 RepID=G7YCL3_CLOSI|nr:intraflagellar transport protein 80 homolog [Clonorchis sinensis]